jgi:NADPH:quinone reductase
MDVLPTRTYIALFRDQQETTMSPSDTQQVQLRSTVRKDGKLELSLARVEIPAPKPDEVLVRIEAAPINPSDLGLLFGGADMTTARTAGSDQDPVVTADIPAPAMRFLAARIDQSLPVGNEGAGIVVEAGSSEKAQSLIGKTVAILGGAMYAQYRCLRADQCLVLPPGTTPAEGASCFVNPLTVLGMVETMRREGHTGLVHTAAASNLGQMLVRLCSEDDIPLVNVVRRDDQVALLKEQGARYVCNSSAPTFMEDLTGALRESGATIAFDAIGGGDTGSRILTCMEAALSAKGSGFSRYGSTTHKQLYIYGGLDRSPTVLNRAYGMAWGIGGWLLTPFLEKIGPEAAQRLRERVAAEIKTTFASQYTKEVSLAEALQLDAIHTYGKQATGQKFLVNPNKGLS